MKKLLLIASCFASIQSFAVVHEVEVGGGGANGTPFYAPQELSILVGDVVSWVWTSGTHNVTSTSGPESFMSANLNSPNEWAFTFEMAGVYEYECTLFNHSDTQFGTITVGADNVAEKAIATPNFDVYPNPAGTIVTVEKNAAYSSDIKLYDLTGKVVHSELASSHLRTRIDVAQLTKGIYFVEMTTNGRAVRRRLIVE